MRAQDLADAAVGDEPMGDDEGDTGDADVELEAHMTRLMKALKAGDAAAAAKAFRGAMEACG
jgi:hypothetical protein